MSERVEPYRLAFLEPGLVERHFPAIAAAGQAGALDLRVPDIFLMLPETGELVHDLGAEGPYGSAPLGLLAFHAFRYWRAGEVQVSVAESELRTLLAAPGIGSWSLRTPAEAGYVQLPRHLVWTPPDPDAAEAVDGFFWSLAGDASAPLHLLLVEGLHPARAGFSVFEVSAPVPRAGHWADVQARDDGADFANLLPGGELRGLFGLTTAGELLKLASRVFHHLERHGPVRDRAGAGGDRQSPRANG